MPMMAVGASRVAVQGSTSSLISSSNRGKGACRALANRTSPAAVPRSSANRRLNTVCAANYWRDEKTHQVGLGDFVGGDFLGSGPGQMLNVLEEDGAVGLYAPPEGGAEGRYASWLGTQGCVP